MPSTASPLLQSLATPSAGSLSQISSIPTSSPTSFFSSSLLPTTASAAALLSQSSSSSSSSSSLSPLPTTRTSEAVHAIVMSMWLLTMVAGAVGNALLCVTIGLNSSLHTAMNIYVFSIGLVDLVTCLGLLPLRLVAEYATHAGTGVSVEIQDIEFFIRVFTDVGRLLLMQSLTLERFQAIASPFAVTKAQARRRAKIVVLVHGLLSLLAATLGVRYLCDTTLHYHCSVEKSNSKISPLTLDAHPDTISKNDITTTTRNITVLQVTLPIAETTFYNNYNTSNTTIPIPETKAVISSEWGLIETCIELPLTLITVLIIISSYSFILIISRQQKRKVSSHSNAHVNTKTKSNQVSPATVETAHHQQPTSPSPKKGSDNAISGFIHTIEAGSSTEGEFMSPSAISFHKKEKEDDHNFISLSLSELRNDAVNVSQRKYSLPPGDFIQWGGNNHDMISSSDMEINILNTKHESLLHVSPLFYKQEMQCKKSSRQDLIPLTVSVSLIQQGIDNPAFTENVSIQKEGNSHMTSTGDLATRVYTLHSNKNESIIIHVKENASDELRSNEFSQQSTLAVPSQNEINQSTTTSSNVSPTSNRNTISDPITQEVPSRATDKPLDGAVCLMTNSNKLLGRRGVELKAAFKVTFLFGCFVCLWMPFPMSVTIMRTFVSSERYGTFMNVTAILSSVATCTAAIDSIVYGLFNPQIMARMVSLKKTCRRRITAVTSRWF